MQLIDQNKCWNHSSPKKHCDQKNQIKKFSSHKFCTGKEWEDASQYQLSIDTGKLDISDAADMIINYINAKNIGQKHL